MKTDLFLRRSSLRAVLADLQTTPPRLGSKRRFMATGQIELPGNTGLKVAVGTDRAFRHLLHQGDFMRTEKHHTPRKQGRTPLTDLSPRPSRPELQASRTTQPERRLCLRHVAVLGYN